MRHPVPVPCVSFHIMNGVWRTVTTLYTSLVLDRTSLSSMSALLKLSDDGIPDVHVPTSLLNKTGERLVMVMVMVPFSQTIIHRFVKVDF